MLHRMIYLIIIFWVLLVCSPAQAQNSNKGKAVDPKADKILQQMSEYLKSCRQFTVQADTSIDAILDTGYKLQMGRSADVYVQRPDRLRVNIKTNVADQQFFYDGKHITLFGKKVNYFARSKAPSTIESALDYAEQSLGLVAPAADLLYTNSYSLLTEDVRSSHYFGLTDVLGVQCHHLAFRAEQTDWQIWIENSKTPFPRKFVITSRFVAGAPQFTALFSKWNASAQLQDSMFVFVPPKGAKNIEFLRYDK